MNVYCVICSDLLTAAADVYITKCGHMFHYTCLINWLERKKTCPHCRNSVTEKTILKVYFNLADNDDNSQDVGTLINKVDNLQFQISLNQKDLKSYKLKAKTLNETNAALRKEINKLESDLRTYESTIHALKDQISFFKSKSKESDRLNAEIAKLKQTMRDVQSVQLAIDGTRDEVMQMLKNENNIESLAILAATLKKSLLDMERRKRELDVSNKKILNDNSKLKKELSELHCENSNIKKEIEHMKINFEGEKKYLKNKIMNLGKQLAQDEIQNNSLDTIALESPINFNRTPKLKPFSADSLTRSTKTSHVSTINDSPYLSIKSNSHSIDYNSTTKSKHNLGSITSKSGFSIFKSSQQKPDETKIPRTNKSEFYDGLGGSSKDDIFPSPKKSQSFSLKRQKSSSSVSSNKMKKLAPMAGVLKVDDFFEQL